MYTMKKFFSGIYDKADLGNILKLKKDYHDQNDVPSDLAEFLYYSESSFKGFSKKSILRKNLNKIYSEDKTIIHHKVSDIVSRYTASVKQRKSKEYCTKSHMQSLFYCNCGWLLYNPVTLPCGHTMCKDCVEEFMFCKYCGLTIEKTSSVNHFLVDLITVWFKVESKLCKMKKDCLDLMNSQDYQTALEKINYVIKQDKDDYNALNIRSEIKSKQGEHREALKDAELSCKINYNCAKSHFRRGMCFSNIGNLNEAIDAFQICLEIEPNDVKLSNDVIRSIDTILTPPEPTNLQDCKESTFHSDEDDSDHENTLESKSLEKEINSKSNKTSSVNSNLSSEIQEKETEADSSGECEGTSSIKSDVSEHSLIKNENSKKNSTVSIQPKKDPVIEKNGVPIDLIKDDDVECKLCFELLYQPVTTTCGHVFCRRCLLRTLDHNAVCPICRLSLLDYVRSSSKPTTLIIEEILRIYFSEQYQERKTKFEERMKELNSYRIGKDENVPVPIFLCSVAFPYVQCPLHIFEPKYRLMIRESLESGSRKFGMCVPGTAGEVSDIGTICEIKKCQNLPDGRYIIHTIAKQRFFVSSTVVEDSQLYAKVSYFVDEPEDLTSEQFLDTSKLIYNQLSKYINSLTPSEQDCIFNALGILPNYIEDYGKYDHGAPWIWWGLAAVPLNLTAKLVLLRCKCASERMASLQRFLRFLTRLQPSAESSSRTLENEMSSET